MKKFIWDLVKPKSHNDDIARKEFILNIILLCTITLSMFALFANISYFFAGRTSGSGLILSTSIILIVFLSLLYLSKKGKSIISANVFIALLTLICLLSSAGNGVHYPEILLVYALTITMSGILISATFSIVLTVIISVALILITTKSEFVGSKVIQWQMVDTVVAVITIAIIAVMSWLSNREIEKSLKRARKSEAELKKERDLLEIRVDERTKELKQAQLEKLSQMGHFAELGKLASGIFHDLVNPLTAVSLNLGQLKNIDSSQMQGMKVYLNQALDATKKMENFMGIVRKQISTESVKNFFSPAKEIKDSIQIVKYKINSKSIDISSELDSSLKMFGSNLKFSQIVTNLISNSIDSFSEKSTSKNIWIKLYEKDKRIVLQVADDGCGIPDEYKDNVFNPFFTTKNFDNGTGIGLAIVKDAVENHFLGKIMLDSDSKGTKFTITIPSNLHD